MDRQGSNLCGWELNNPDDDIFDIEIMEVFGDCGDCELLGECTTPCASVRRLVPKEGRIVELGHEREQGGPKMSYFALLNQDGVKFILLSEPDHYWARAGYVAHEQVPPWALSQLDTMKKRGLGDALSAA
jgi:hypothetical protein